MPKPRPHINLTNRGLKKTHPHIKLTNPFTQTLSTLVQPVTFYTNYIHTSIQPVTAYQTAPTPNNLPFINRRDLYLLWLVNIYSPKNCFFRCVFLNLWTGFQVSATDEDSGLNGQITYSFINDLAKTQFNIDADGLITTVQRLDRENPLNKDMVLTVMALDGGGNIYLFFNKSIKWIKPTYIKQLT